MLTHETGKMHMCVYIYTYTCTCMYKYAPVYIIYVNEHVNASTFQGVQHISQTYIQCFICADARNAYTATLAVMPGWLRLIQGTWGQGFLGRDFLGPALFLKPQR